MQLKVRAKSPTFSDTLLLNFDAAGIAWPRIAIISDNMRSAAGDLRSVLWP